MMRQASCWAIFVAFAALCSGLDHLLDQDLKDLAVEIEAPENTCTTSSVKRTVTTIEVNSGNVAAYLNGFTIQANTTVVWNASSSSSKVNGAIIFADDSSILQLNNDLYLGLKGTFVASKTFINIYGKNKTIFLGGNTTISAVDKIINVVHDDSAPTLTIDGQGKTLTCDLGCNGRFKGGRHRLDNFWILPTCITMKNLTLNFAKKASSASVACVFASFDTVTLDAVKLISTNSGINDFCDTSCRQLVLNNNVRISLPPGKQSQTLRLLDGELIFNLATGSTLTIDPGISFFPGPSTRVTNAGRIINNGTFMLAGSFENRSGSFMNNGTFAVSKPLWGIVTTTGSGITVPLLLSEDSIAVSDGTFQPTDCSNGFVIAGDVSVRDSITLNSQKKAVITQAGFLDIASSNQLLIYGALTNNGTMSVSGSLVIAARASLFNTGVIKNLGTLTLQTSGALLNAGVLGFSLGSNFGALAINNNNGSSNNRLSTLRQRQLKPLVGGHLVPVFNSGATITNTGNGFLLADCTDGFIISADSTVTWNDATARTRVQGPIIFEGYTAVLDLASDFYLGANGNLIATDYDISIHGHGKKIVLGGNILLNNGILCDICLFSNLTIDGKSNGSRNYVLRCENFDSFYDCTEDSQSASLTLQNLVFEAGVTEFLQFGPFHPTPIFTVKTVFNNVIVHGLRTDINPLFRDEGYSLAIQGNVIFEKNTGTGNYFKVVDWRFRQRPSIAITIAIGATLKFDGCIVELARSTESTSCSIALANTNSTLWLNNTNFYTGANGLTLNNGVLRYFGTVNIYNGDNVLPFVANTDGSRAFVVQQPCFIARDFRATVRYFGQYSIPRGRSY